jgi:hypothetical protein
MSTVVFRVVIPCTCSFVDCFQNFGKVLVNTQIHGVTTHITIDICEREGEQVHAEDDWLVTLLLEPRLKRVLLNKRSLPSNRFSIYNSVTFSLNAISLLKLKSSSN